MSAINSEIGSAVGVSTAFTGTHEIPEWHPKLQCGDAVGLPRFLQLLEYLRLSDDEALTPG